MDEMKRFKFAVYVERYYNLRLHEGKHMRKILDDRKEFHLDKSALYYIMFLHRRIRDTLKVITETHEMGEKYIPDQPVTILHPTKQHLNSNMEDELKRTDYILFSDRYYNLLVNEEKTMSNILKSRQEFHLYETPLNHILFLHRNIRDTLKVITETREMRQKETPQEKVQVLEKNYRNEN